MQNTETIKAIYIAKKEFTSELSHELEALTDCIGSLFFSSYFQPNVCFAQDTWLAPEVVKFASISQAVNILKQAGKFWYHHPIAQIRRATLIANQLRKLPTLQRTFPLTTEIPKTGAFSLLDQNTLVYSATRLKQWPDGKCRFIEDKINPPNRAYLKLWEAFTFLGKYPKAGDTALDLGASPGGWTYVLQSLGAQVTAVDKADLDTKIASLPQVKFLKQSAFSLDPLRLNQNYTWVLSDVACYPERAYQLIKRWISSGRAQHLIFTIKLQGKTDLDAIKLFKEIPNSRIINLFYNKHEATFFYPFNEILS
ncbi:SAM-dependent methyltransferase [Legionella septentrionalis]|uniref:SAM-dependent methyltransferase n=1 Tax=Legionella septentrionalis TaxID=2498109 RepID=A0A3S0X1T4_9GAMM|nr:SAM-dependent methyltransferase [Legionella septentrionalis]RUQ90785.1 SAM-dependent methyltransferase [Legionella septentrionalis]RUR09193.1 SAM-dependent methyltransferase [Legionella septentrionalis]